MANLKNFAASIPNYWIQGYKMLEIVYISMYNTIHQ